MALHSPHPSPLPEGEGDWFGVAACKSVRGQDRSHGFGPAAAVAFPFSRGRRWPSGPDEGRSAPHPARRRGLVSMHDTVRAMVAGRACSYRCIARIGAFPSPRGRRWPAGPDEGRSAPHPARRGGWYRCTTPCVPCRRQSLLLHVHRAHWQRRGAAPFSRGRRRPAGPDEGRPAGTRHPERKSRPKAALSDSGQPYSCGPASRMAPETLNFLKFSMNFCASPLAASS